MVKYLTQGSQRFSIGLDKKMPFYGFRQKIIGQKSTGGDHVVIALPWVLAKATCSDFPCHFPAKTYGYLAVFNGIFTRSSISFPSYLKRASV